MNQIEYTVVGGTSVYTDMNCDDISDPNKLWSSFLADSSYGGKNISEACCVCGGGDHKPGS